jgi:hypothetical protein
VLLELLLLHLHIGITPTLHVIQGTFGVIQGTFGFIQGTFVIFVVERGLLEVARCAVLLELLLLHLHIIPTFGVIQGTFVVIQGTFGVI